MGHKPHVDSKNLSAVIKARTTPDDAARFHQVAARDGGASEVLRRLIAAYLRRKKAA